MSTFLKICQDTARQAGLTESRSVPTSVLNQDGTMGLIVDWVAESWVDIQREKNYWKFQYQAFTATMVQDLNTYAASDLGITRLNRWVTGADESKLSSPMWVYDKAIGASDERPIAYVPYSQFRDCYMRGDNASVTGRPQYFTVEPDNELTFYPIPDQAYGLKGEYYKSAQNLAANADVPDMPADYHSLIKWVALGKYATYDEAQVQAAGWFKQERTLRSDLVRDQTPKFTIAGALA